MLFPTKLYQIVQSCSPITANQTLGICVIPVVALCCGAHVFYAIESGVAFCATPHTAISTLTLPYTRLVAHQSTQQ